MTLKILILNNSTKWVVLTPKYEKQKITFYSAIGYSLFFSDFITLTNEFLKRKIIEFFENGKTNQLTELSDGFTIRKLTIKEYETINQKLKQYKIISNKKQQFSIKYDI